MHTFLDPRKKYIMISQPMREKTNEEIIKEREKIISIVKDMGFEYLDTFHVNKKAYIKENEWIEDIKNIPLYMLAAGLKDMSKCHAVYFCKGWENARGCRIEHLAAIAYGLEVIYE